MTDKRECLQSPVFPIVVTVARIVECHRSDVGIDILPFTERIWRSWAETSPIEEGNPWTQPREPPTWRRMLRAMCGGRSARQISPPPAKTIDRKRSIDRSCRLPLSLSYLLWRERALCAVRSHDITQGVSRSLPYDIATCGPSVRQKASAPLSRSSLIWSVKLVERPPSFPRRVQSFIFPSGSTARDFDRSPSPQYDRPS